MHKRGTVTKRPKEQGSHVSRPRCIKRREDTATGKATAWHQARMNYSADVDAAHAAQLSGPDELQIQSLARHYTRMLSEAAESASWRDESRDCPLSCDLRHERHFNLHGQMEHRGSVA